MRRDALAALALLGLALLPSCVTVGRMKREVAQKVDAQKKEDDLQKQTMMTQVAVAVAALRERLVRFNQIDESGNLIPLKPRPAPAAAAPVPAAPSPTPKKSMFGK